MKISISILLSFLVLIGVAQTRFITPYEKSQRIQTTTYEECIQYYKLLAKSFKTISIKEAGPTDAGFPLHQVILSKNKVFDAVKVKEKGLAVILINNAIHPGEPEGVDATMMLIRDLAFNVGSTDILDHVVIVVIPIYNIGGALNRSCCSRANQNGPEEYGFRGNAKNLDLNRDFIKSDSKNNRSFMKIFQEWKPDIFIDTHTSNGADYQYVMTYIASQHSKLSPFLDSYMEEHLVPALEKEMIEANQEMTPYVQSMKAIPDSGIYSFLDNPRYATGYTALFNTFGFITETHMLKPFHERVDATYDFMNSMIKVVNRDYEEIKEMRYEADQWVIFTKDLILDWKLSDSYRTINFKGYEAKYKKSEVTGRDRLYYDKSEPYEKEIKYYDYYDYTNRVEVPYAYIIPQAYDNIKELMEINDIEIKKLTTDIELEVEIYRIDSFKTTKNPYEQHYMHYHTHVSSMTKKVKYIKGDYVIVTAQVGKRYIVETLEPEASDSYFNWNFFDNILQQKEWYSSYVFEDIAAKMLEEDADLKKEFEDKKAADKNFAESARAQLYFLYKRSIYYEQNIKQYPVGRLKIENNLPLH